MASFARTCRMSARLTARQLRQDATAVRGFRTSTPSLAAQNFTMPALSPTMTEGNISKWNLKEGDSFSAGDVLLEIETDKASMDVEAQDDGILAKIVVGDGSKGIQVGSRIAILAEEGDDISSLEFPAEESGPKKETKSESAEKPKEKEAKQEENKPAKKSADKKSSSPVPAQTKPFFPAVEALLKEHNLTSSDVSQMNPSGPKGRLIKGDVLAYIGKTSSSSYATDLGARLEKLSQLDLSNIKIPPPKKAAAPESTAKEASKEEQKTDVAVQISMKAVLEVQKRIQASLGVFLPISTFINRAVDLANDELPLPRNYKPTADELFNDILGLDSVVTSRGTRGTFVPQIAAFPPTASLVAPPSRTKSSKKVDVLDQLIGGGKKSAFKKQKSLVPGLSSGENVFSVSVAKGEEKRAGVFLERVKVVLEGEPGRLVI